jgi:hypothetical protein
MGGFGSGRHSYATTPTVGESLHLDADELTDGVEYPGVTGQKVWGDESDPTAELTLHSTLHVYKHLQILPSQLPQSRNYLTVRDLIVLLWRRVQARFDDHRLVDHQSTSGHDAR